MTRNEFFNLYQVLYRRFPGKIQYIILEKNTGEVRKRYGFDVGEVSNQEFEMLTNLNLEEEIAKVVVDSIYMDFNITD